MLALTLMGFLLGSVLAQRFTVLILLPPFALTLFFAICASIANPSAALSAALAAAAVIVAQQIGYLFGIGVRAITPLSRARGLSARETTKPATSGRPAH